MAPLAAGSMTRVSPGVSGPFEPPSAAAGVDQPAGGDGLQRHAAVGRAEPSCDVHDEMGGREGEHAQGAAAEAHHRLVGAVLAGQEVHLRAERRRGTARVGGDVPRLVGLGDGEVDGNRLGRDRHGAPGDGERDGEDGPRRPAWWAGCRGEGDTGVDDALRRLLVEQVAARAEPAGGVDDEVGGGEREQADGARRVERDDDEVRRRVADARVHVGRERAARRRTGRPSRSPGPRPRWR